MMIRITGTEKETDYIIAQLACGTCEGCPGRKACKGNKTEKGKEEKESCGETIRKCIEIINDDGG